MNMGVGPNREWERFKILKQQLIVLGQNAVQQTDIPFPTPNCAYREILHVWEFLTGSERDELKTDDSHTKKKKITQSTAWNL